MARSRILLVSPPIYDFTACDFWLRPYRMLRVAGHIQHACGLETFDFLVSRMTDSCGRGRFPEELIARPQALRDIPRRFRRFGRLRDEFCEFLQRRQWADIEEPLSHNKTAFTIRRLGVQQVNRMKGLCRELNSQIPRGEQPC